MKKLHTLLLSLMLIFNTSAIFAGHCSTGDHDHDHKNSEKTD